MPLSLPMPPRATTRGGRHLVDILLPLCSVEKPGRAPDSTVTGQPQGPLFLTFFGSFRKEGTRKFTEPGVLGRRQIPEG